MRARLRVANGVPQDHRAELNNGGRWHHIASEHEIRRVLSARGEHAPEVIECPIIMCTFLVSLRHLTIVRASAMGGDTFNVEGGWVYPNSIAMMLDKYELIRVSEVITNRG